MGEPLPAVCSRRTACKVPPSTQHPLALPQHHERIYGTFSVHLFHVYLLSLDRIAAGDSAGVCAPAHGIPRVAGGLVISIQYIATFLSRPWAGASATVWGPRFRALGMGACTASGVLLLGAAALHRNPPWLSLTILLASRLVLAWAKAWVLPAQRSGASRLRTGQHCAGDFVQRHRYLWSAALGAPLGVVMEQQWGLTSIGIITIVLCGASVVFASRKAPVPVVHGEHLPFRDVLGRVTPHGWAWRWAVWDTACWRLLLRFFT